VKENFEAHDGIIDGDSQIPSFGRYVDLGGVWFDDFVLTIDHLVYSDTSTEEPEVRVRVNGKDLYKFLWFIETGSESDESIGIVPKDDVFRESYETRLNRKG